MEAITANDYALTVGSLTFRLAREFGFCYGVDRAVEYAYETRRKFPGRRIYLVGEIIHNPHVNRKMEDMGITFLQRSDGERGDFDFSGVEANHVVILPAFGVTKTDFDRLRTIGCVMVDTTVITSYSIHYTKLYDRSQWGSSIGNARPRPKRRPGTSSSSRPESRAGGSKDV